MIVILADGLPIKDRVSQWLIKSLIKWTNYVCNVNWYTTYTLDVRGRYLYLMVTNLHEICRFCDYAQNINSIQFDLQNHIHDSELSNIQHHEFMLRVKIWSILWKKEWIGKKLFSSNRMRFSHTGQLLLSDRITVRMSNFLRNSNFVII